MMLKSVLLLSGVMLSLSSMAGGAMALPAFSAKDCQQTWHWIRVGPDDDKARPWFTEQGDTVINCKADGFSADLSYSDAKYSGSYRVEAHRTGNRVVMKVTALNTDASVHNYSGAYHHIDATSNSDAITWIEASYGEMYFLLRPEHQ